ncbi:MAG: M3 family oligoendopeptidase [Opitutales bacterium]
MIKQADASREPDPAEALPEWDLSDYYPGRDSQALQADLERVKTDAATFADRWKGQLTEASPAQLGEAVRTYESVQELIGKIGSYAYLQYAEQTTDPVRGKFLGDLQEQLNAVQTQLLFFELELNQLSDDALETALGADAGLAHYRPWLMDIRREKPYQLEERLERLFYEKSQTGRQAWNRLFDETLGEMKVRVGDDELTLVQTFDRFQDPDGDVRKAAALAVGERFRKELRLFTQITNTLAKDKAISDNWRGFKDVAASRHLANRVEPETVDALVAAVRDAYPRTSHRFYRLKARMLGKDKLEHWDRNAPVSTEPEPKISWERATAMVLDAYAGFSPELGRLGRQFFDQPWIDAPPREGKDGGAFASPGVPSVHPYLLLNYLGKPRDVMTLAHELGHGVHQCLANEQGVLMGDTPLTLAETASVFGEMLTFRKLLGETDDAERRKVMLADKIQDMINTVVRQIAFYQFERRVHEDRKNGELTREAICDHWMAVQTESLGDAFTWDDSYRVFWSYIPHFIHTPFYVYAYAFGDCLVNSLYAVYQESPDGFEDRYFALLRAGGSQPYNDLLQPFGLDARDPGFWQKGLGMIEGLIDELDTLVG